MRRRQVKARESSGRGGSEAEASGRASGDSEISDQKPEVKLLSTSSKRSVALAGELATWTFGPQQAAEISKPSGGQQSCPAAVIAGHCAMVQTESPTTTPGSSTAAARARARMRPSGFIS